MSEAVLAPAAIERELVPVGDWHPTTYTPTLTGSEEFDTDGDRLITAAARYWSTAEVERFVLDEWQQWLIRHVLERYPADWPDRRLAGQFRYRQVVISMGRQNGKSVLGALFGFYGLMMHARGPLVIGLASSVDQAGIVYKRVKYAVDHNPILAKRLKPTGTRGISHRDGSGEYLLKPAKGDAIQGLPVSMVPFDELHIAPPDMWAAVVNGQKARPTALVLGITTAGDDDSTLLKSLYEQGHKSVQGAPDHERFGFFLWEAPEGATLDNDQHIIAANPAIASGRVDLETARSDARLLPDPDVQRYVFNRWISSINSWLPLATWNKHAGGRVDPADSGVVFTIARTSSWEWASIVATVKRDDGTLHTEVVASVPRPNTDQLVALCVALSARAANARFAADSLMLGALVTALKRRGLDARKLTLTDKAQAAACAYANIVQGNVRHGGDQLLTVQVPAGRRKNVPQGDGWRLSRADSADVDAVEATVDGIYVADSEQAPTMQVF